MQLVRHLFNDRGETRREPQVGIAVVAALLLLCLKPGTFYTKQQALKRFAQHCSVPEACLQAALDYEFLQVDQTDSVAYDDRSWLPAPYFQRPVLPAIPHFSYFHGPITNLLPYRDITPYQFWQVLTGPSLATVTQQLREQPVGSPVRNQLKRALPYVTPAGCFTRRQEGAMTARSGLLVLDLDHVPDVVATRHQLLQTPDLPIVLLFTSPSGDGLKVFLSVSLQLPHRDVFEGVSRYLSQQLGLVPDRSGKDLARACFACHDPQAWLHPAFFPPAV